MQSFLAGPLLLVALSVACMRDGSQGQMLIGAIVDEEHGRRPITFGSALTIRDTADEGALLRAECLLLVREARSEGTAATAAEAAIGWRMLLGEVG